MSKYLYEIKFKKRDTDPDWKIFVENALKLNAKTRDYTSIQRQAIVSHTQNVDTVHMLLTDGMIDEACVLVEQITKSTLTDEKSGYFLYRDLIEKYFKPFDAYPNL